MTLQRLRHGSAIAQLENDQYLENEGSSTDRAGRRGWNAGVQRVLRAQRDQRAFTTYKLPETEGDHLTRAYRRGFNRGTQHALDVVRLDAGLRELADAPRIETIDHPIVDISGEFDLGGEG